MTQLEQALTNTRPEGDGCRRILLGANEGRRYPYLAAHLNDGQITVWLRFSMRSLALLADWREVADLPWRAA